MSQLKLLANDAGLFLGLFQIGSGLFGTIDPVAMGRNFGIKTTPLNAVFFPGLAARNIAGGLVLLTLSALGGQDRALGVLMTAWTLCGLADIKILRDNPPHAGMPVHVLFTAMLALSGVTLLMQ